MRFSHEKKDRLQAYNRNFRKKIMLNKEKLGSVMLTEN